MFKILIAGALLLTPISASAEECQFPFDATLSGFASAGAPWKLIPDDVLPKFEKLAEAALDTPLDGVTRGFVVVSGGKILLALEVDDCLLPPIAIGRVNEVSVPLSGRDKADGRVGA